MYLNLLCEMIGLNKGTTIFKMLRSLDEYSLTFHLKGFHFTTFSKYNRKQCQIVVIYKINLKTY